MFKVGTIWLVGYLLVFYDPLPSGMMGDNGDMGEQGLRGENGTKGELGPKGEDGDQGEFMATLTVKVALHVVGVYN